MSLKEIQSIQVDNGKEDDAVRMMMSFGWELKHKQRVKTQDSQEYTGQSSDYRTSYYQTTKGDDFVELTFERDPDRKNYAELKALEDQYYVPLPTFKSCPPTEPREPKKLDEPKSYEPTDNDEPSKPGIGALIVMIISFLVGGFFEIAIIVDLIKEGADGMDVFAIIFFAGFFIPGIIFLVKKIRYPGKLKEWEDRREYFQQKYKKEKDAYQVAMEAYEKAYQKEKDAYQVAMESYQNKKLEEEKIISEAKKKRADILEKAKLLV